MKLATPPTATTSVGVHVVLWLSALAACALALAFTGCTTARDASRSKIEIDINKLERTGKLLIESPKDYELSDVSITRRDDRFFEVRIGRAQAVVSKAALDAAIEEVRARHSTYAKLASTIEFLADKAAASQGVPQSALKTAAPSGFKWAIGGDGIPVIVPADDPSKPQPEINP